MFRIPLSFRKREFSLLEIGVLGSPGLNPGHATGDCGPGLPRCEAWPCYRRLWSWAPQVRSLAMLQETVVLGSPGSKAGHATEDCGPGLPRFEAWPCYRRLWSWAPQVRSLVMLQETGVLGSPGSKPGHATGDCVCMYRVTYVCTSKSTFCPGSGLLPGGTKALKHCLSHC